MDEFSKIAARYERAVQEVEDPWAFSAAIEIFEPEDEPSRRPGSYVCYCLIAVALAAAWVAWFFWMLEEIGI